ncbi:hypothetical protein BD770DRAFT_351460 [Pilaira anomala]|nr:hypothetical protein BD770DRAFT_351460 [Pilaira anomala]
MSGSSNNRVEPRFFGSPDIYNDASRKKKPTVVPDWDDDNPPPPYEPSESSSAPTNASAPPLEMSSPDYPNNPPNNYGTLPQSYPWPNTTPPIVNRNWPWVSPPSNAPPVIGPFSAPTGRPGEYEVFSEVPKERKRTWCERIGQMFLYLFCFCLLFRLIDLLVNGVDISGTCTHGTEWSNVPKEITYHAGLTIRVMGGSLSSGQISIKSVTSDSITGSVHATAVVSPRSLIYNPELNFYAQYLSNGTTLEFHLPQYLPSHACVRLDATIYVPEGTPFITVDVQNSEIIVLDEEIDVKQYRLETTNKDIDFFAKTESQDIKLATTNAKVKLHQSALNSGSIELSSTNGMIIVKEPIEAKNDITIKTSNGAIDVQHVTSQEGAIKLVTTNGFIHASNVSADTIKVRTTNGRVKIDHSHPVSLFEAKSSNAAVYVKLDSGDNVKAKLSTTNAQLTGYFPSHFEGDFDVSTSRYNTVSLVDPIGWTHLKMVRDNHIIGTRYSPSTFEEEEEEGKGTILMSTTNANTFIYFENEQ